MTLSPSDNANLPVEKLAGRLKETVDRPMHLMLMCSGFRVTLLKNKLAGLLPQQLHLHDGPACPACLLPPAFIDKLTAYSRRNNVIVATFQDLLGIPGTETSLEKIRSAGADVRVVSSLWDVLLLAKKNRRKRIVFPAIGFESAASSTAAALLQAKVAGLFNFQVLTGHRRLVTCMKTALENKTFPLHGVVTSGRVAASMGVNYFREVSRKYQLPMVISGYQPEELLHALLALVKQIQNGTHETENLFPEAVSDNGNPKSHQLLEEVFSLQTAFCNGYGMVPEAGFAINRAYRMFDAEKVFFDETLPVPTVQNECPCAEIMKGTLLPEHCPHFKKTCNPVHALGSCMHSEEGPCRVAYLYGTF